MKKRLEADLISIAHRILQLKNKSDINLLYLETQKLYEKLAVLRFIDSHFGETKPTIGLADVEKEVENFLNQSGELPIKTVIEMAESFPDVTTTSENKEPEEVTTTETQKPTIEAAEEVSETASSEIKEKENPETETTEEIVIAEEKAETETITETTKSETKAPTFKAAFELSEEVEEEVEIDTPKKAEAVQISFDDLLGVDYTEPLFVKVDEVNSLPKKNGMESAVKTETEEESVIQKEEKLAAKETPKVVSLNDKLSKGIDIDLNDRIAFVKHLFGNSNEDYNRVLNQLITFDNFYETKNFIDEMVKPDYNNWKGKDDYVDRFMEIIEKKFL